jgi:hypothetical protein
MVPAAITIVWYQSTIRDICLYVDVLDVLLPVELMGCFVLVSQQFNMQRGSVMSSSQSIL